MQNLIDLVMKAIMFLLISMSLAGCSQIPEYIKPVDGFELNRYLGTWYEIARLDHSFERGFSNVTADYRLRDDRGLVVINQGYDSKKGRWKEAVGKAYFVGDTSVGQLKVSFFGPFYGAYNIVALDKESYQWSVVVGPNMNYFWILSRAKELDSHTLEKLLSVASSFGIETENLIFVEHNRSRIEKSH
jgi:apolipoprotein D and lipocalin family protein